MLCRDDNRDVFICIFVHTPFTKTRREMTTDPTTSRHNPMKVIFNYQNVFFSFFYDDADACVHRSREYAMNYVLSGEMVLDDGYRQIHVGKESACSFRATIV